MSRNCTGLLHAGRPPHGGRGLKFDFDDIARSDGRSPSPRRAWIEIPLSQIASVRLSGRPPHGGRGLKFALSKFLYKVSRVALPTEGVD